MSAAREEMLARIRTALGDLQPTRRPATARDAQPAGVVLDAEERVARFVARAADYRAHVLRVADDAGVPAAVAAACARHGAQALLAPDDLPSAWLPAGLERRSDDALDVEAVAGAEGVITTCAAAIAETGTIVLDAGPGQGRRLLTLLPDLHVCVVPVERIVADVPDALALLDRRRPLTLISGPSATSDIELERVEGVHGPRRLELIVLG